MFVFCVCFYWYAMLMVLVYLTLLNVCLSADHSGGVGVFPRLASFGLSPLSYQFITSPSYPLGPIHVHMSHMTVKRPLYSPRVTTSILKQHNSQSWKPVARQNTR